MFSKRAPVKDFIRISIENNPCSVCRFSFIPPPCRGHAAGGGGGGGSGSGEGAKGEKSAPVLFYNIKLAKDGSIQATDKDRNIIQIPSPEKDLFIALIKSLSEKITITIDKDGALIFEINRQVSGKEKELLLNFIENVKDECQKFMVEKGYKANKIEEAIVEKDNQLIIKFPNVEHRKEFVYRISQNILSLFQQRKNSKEIQKNKFNSEDEKAEKRPSPKSKL